MNNWLTSLVRLRLFEEGADGAVDDDVRDRDVGIAALSHPIAPVAGKCSERIRPRSFQAALIPDRRDEPFQARGNESSPEKMIRKSCLLKPGITLHPPGHFPTTKATGWLRAAMLK